MSKLTYLTSDQVDALRALASDCAERAEAVLSELGPRLRKAAHLFQETASKAIPSRIPEHPTVSYERPVIGDFVAVMTDIRDSTQHLRVAIKDTYSLVERVYFETNIALPIFAKITEFFDGSATEYLGDGTLSLFAVNEDKPDEGCKRAYRASYSALEALTSVINPQVEARKLPALKIGVGIGRSRALVSAVGLPEALQPNAFGECVFFASKLSKWGENEIYADETFRSTFKATEGGKLSFRSHKAGDIGGYLISRSN